MMPCSPQSDLRSPALRTRLTGLIAVSLLLVPLTTQLQVFGQPVATVEDRNSYAIYGAALSATFEHDGTKLTHVTLLDETRAGSMDCPSEESVSRQLSQWRDAIADYRKQNTQMFRIQADRDLGVPYSLITWSSLSRMMQDAGYDLSTFSGGQSPGRAQFRSLRGGRLVAVSAVGFDASRTRAMVSVLHNCFPATAARTPRARCHGGYQWMLEKWLDTWKVMSMGCGWIA
jgi:hypothetical protein